MSLRITTVIIVLIAMTDTSLLYSQIISGRYSGGLNVAFNPGTNKVTGYYENYTGEDESTGQPKFSCVFHISGEYAKDSFGINAFYALDKDSAPIKGELQVKGPKVISIKLKEEPDGCWNVQPFVDEFTEFTLDTEFNWVEIACVTIDKAYFHSDKNVATKRKAYVIKGNVVYIDKIEGEWIHCFYYGKSVTEGWLKGESIN